VEKELQSFRENRNVCQSCRLLRRKEIYAINIDAKTIILERNKKYRLDNQEIYRENKKNYEREHKDEARERGVKFRALNSETIALKKKYEYIKNSENIKLKVATWRKNNLPKKRANNLKRRARVNGADGYGYTTVEHIEMRWSMWGSNCWLCGNKAEATDHVIPLGSGGTHWPSNLRPVCKSCNSGRKKKYLGIEKSNIGNAIVPQVAASFIKAFMEAT
jgi:5-methylcytosine-specific restriction endonuclease McrA